MVPSLVAPIFISIEVDDVGPLALNTSSRLMTALTGRFALRDNARACGKIKVLSVSALLAEAIRRIHNEDSVSSLFV